jgi:hypothetical protein
MSADEIIEQIKALPPSEREKVFAFFRELNTRADARVVRYMDDKTVTAAKEHVFATHEDLLRRLAQ